MGFPRLFQADILSERYLGGIDMVGLEVQGEEGAVRPELGLEGHAALDRLGLPFDA